MDRRFLLKSIASVLAMKGWGSAAIAQPKQLRRFIDVHCHFFNAADLPVRGFLERVVFADYAFSQTASVIPVSVWRGLIAKLADFVAKQRAPSPQAELVCLRDAGQCNGFSLTAPRVASRGFSARAPAAPGAAANAADPLTDVLESVSERSLPMTTRSLAPAAPGSPPATTRSLAPAASGSAGEEDENAFTDYILKEMGTTDSGGNQVRTRSLRAAPAPQTRGIFQSAADFLRSGQSVFSRYFDWAVLLTDYRANIAKTYLSLYDPAGTQLKLATPALVDYNFWLEDQSPSTLSEQIEVMASLSLHLPKPVHAFAPFDPLRELRRVPGETAPLELTKNAVLNRGFLGVKLYSPMGFRPSGNAEKGLPFPAYASRTDPVFGQKLDDALDRLYAWCQAEDVPILAHSTDSQSAGPEFASRAEPKFWDAVFRKYPKLKVNLAHFGNFSQAMTGGGDPLSRFEVTWEREIGLFIKDGRYPNVYADISYFYWVLDGSDNANAVAAVKTLFKRYIDAFDPKVERLLFGTDWNMIAKAKAAGQYIGNVEAFFKDIGLNETQLDNLFYANAVRFLGLNGNTKASVRLGRFYRDNGRQPPVFAL